MFRGRGNYENNDQPSSRGTGFGRGQGFSEARDSGAPQSFGRGRGNYENNDQPSSRGTGFGRGRGNFENNDQPSNRGNGFGRGRGNFESNDQPSNRGNGFGRGRGNYENNDQPSNRNTGFGRGRGNYENNRGGFGGESRGGFRQNDQNDFGSESRRGGGFGARGRDNFDGPPRRDFNGDNFDGPPRRGGFRQNDQNDFDGPPRRGGFRQNDQNDFDGPPRRGGFRQNDQNGFDGESRRGDFGGARGRGNFDGPPRRDFNGDNFDGPSRRGGFGNDRNDRDDFGGREPARSFVPKLREVDEIFNEDNARAKVADNLFDTDCNVEVIGGPENVRIYETWEDANFLPQILDNIRRSNYAKPRKFQQYAMPLILDGYDVKGQAETGSGKSAAFLLPIIQRLAVSFAEEPDAPRRMKVSALVIEPTRELAKQLYEQASKFAHNTDVKVNFCYGEYNMGVNKRSLETSGCDILVGTPGRMKHLLSEGHLKLEGLQFLVLDEADRLLEQSFMEEIVQMTQFPNFPDASMRQTLFFSATFDGEIALIANELCRKDSVMIKNKVSTANKRIQQKFTYVPINDRKMYLLNMLKKEAEENGGVLPKKLVFVEMKRTADYIATMLSDEGIKAQTVNGDRPQSLREEATVGFRRGEYRVLVVTNVFARGMDFTDLGHVINYELPSGGDRGTYIHRIGRTGRLGEGVATSFFDPDHQPDRDIAEQLIKELEIAGQEVPDFIRQATSNTFTSFARRDAPAVNNRNGPVAGFSDDEVNEPEF